VTARRATTPACGPAALAILVAAVAAAAPPRVLAAQERLVGARTAAAAPTFEVWSFGGGGAPQAGAGPGDTVRVRRVAQWSVPVSASVPLGAGWSVDVGGAYAAGEVRLAGAAGRYRLAGLSDVKVRATGRVAGDGVVVTLGLNAPTGRVSLGQEQVQALRVLAAPALALQAPALGTGAAATAGVVLARRLGDWGVAGGASYEYRGRYQPVAALVAGAPAVDFAPGDAVHLSLGADGGVGPHRTALAVTADLFTPDELREGAGTLGATRVRLGPVLTAEWQLRLAAPRFRELTLSVAERYRAPYRRDGGAVAGSSGHYVEGGIRGVVAAPARGGVVVGLDLRHHTGFAADRNLATARATLGGATLGWQQPLGTFRVQATARAQGGRVAASRAGAGARASAVSAGLAVARSY
jgi:hypothetical protein